MSGQIVPLCVNGDAAHAGPLLSEVQAAPTDALLSMSVGQQLRAARTSQGLSAADIAKKLKLSPHQVESLECDDWSRLPCNTIIRGFVRNYARLLGLDSGPLMAMLDRLQAPHTSELEIPQGTNVRVPQEGGVERRDYLRVFSGLAVLGLAVLAYFFFPQDLLQSTVSTLKALTLSRDATPMKAVPEPVSAPAYASAPSKAPEAEGAPPPATSAALTEPAIPVQPVLVPAPAPASAVPANSAAAAVAPPGNSLKFAFRQPSWVEVRDRSGQIIFSQLSQAGSQREIEGQPPFVLVIGNAGQVTLQYKGKPVDLSKRSKEDVARVTVE